MNSISFSKLVSLIDNDGMEVSKKNNLPRSTLKQTTIYEASLWLNDKHPTKETEYILDSLQKNGLNKLQAKELYPVVMSLLKKSIQESVATRCLYLLADMSFVIKLDEEDVLWLIKEKKSLNTSSRGYKLAKADALAKLIDNEIYDASTKKLMEDWIVKIVGSNDEEYVDLLSFALSNNEVNISKNIEGIFINYVNNRPDTEASEEMLVSLARSNSRIATTEIAKIFEKGTYSKPLIEAAILTGDTKLLSFLKSIQKKDPEIMKDYENEIKRIEFYRSVL